VKHPGAGRIDGHGHHRHDVGAPTVAGHEVAQRVGLDHLFGRRKNPLGPDNGHRVVLARVTSGDILQPRGRDGGDLLFGSMTRIDSLDGEAIRVLEETREVPRPLRDVETDEAVAAAGVVHIPDRDSEPRAHPWIE
jgi:hypothetical protein